MPTHTRDGSRVGRGSARQVKSSIRVSVMEIYNDQSRDLLGSFEDGMSNEVAACPRGAMQAAARGCVGRRADISIYLSI